MTLSIFRQSAKHLKSVRSLTAAGVLVAAYIVLKAYATVKISASLRISFAFIALAAIGMLFGPVVSVIAAVPCDIIGAVMQGNAIWPELTLIIMFEGLVYGTLLYCFDAKKPIKLIIAQGVVVLVSHLVLNTAVLYRYGIIGGSRDAIFTLIAARVVKNLIELPIHTVLLYIMLIPIKTAYKKASGGSGNI